MAPLLFRGARVFDGESVHTHTDVLVVDGKIAQVGGQLDAPPGAQTIDAAGKTLLPGLIDAHTHTKPPALEMALSFGVTTELDMFSDPAWMIEQRREAQRNNGLADVRSAMIGATVAGSHASGFVGPFFDNPFPVLESAQAADAFVLDRVGEGADYIKVMLEDGSAFGSTYPDLTDDMVTAVIEAAHRHGLMALAHAFTLHGALLAVRRGIDGLVHSFGDEPISDAEVAEFAEAGVFIVPTLSTVQSLFGHHCAAHLADDDRARPYLAADWDANLRESWHVPAPGAYSNAQQTCLKLHRAGIDILAGTDACSVGVPGTAHGVSMHGELELLVEAGLTPIEALQSATSVSARRFGLMDRGVIAPGKQADLLLVDGDPTTRIQDTLSIAGIWRRGEQAPRIAQAGQDSDAPADVLAGS